MDDMNNVTQNQDPQYQDPLGQDPVTPDRIGFAIASLVLGICSVVFTCIYIGLPLAILGLIFGILARKSSKKGMAIAGIILSSAGLVLGVAFILIVVGVLASGILSNLPNMQGY
jgi:thiol:disulfide interchange protein